METVKINISLVGLSELEQLRAISIQTFTETFAKLNTEENMQKYLNENLSCEKLTKELKNPNSEFYFITCNDKPIGYLKVNFGNSQTEQQTEASLEIERIYVLKAYYGKHIGENLLYKAIEIAKQKYYTYLWLGVWEKNVKAIAFYQKHGFEVFDKHVFKLGDDIQNDLLMKLIL